MRRAWHAATPRGRVVGAVALLLVALGVLARYPVVAGLGLCLAGLVVAELVSVLAPARVAVRRTVEPPVVLRHQGCVSTLRFAGHRRRGLARLEAADLVDGTLQPVRLPEGPAAEEVEVRYDIPTPRRGLVDVGPLVLRRHGLLGLASHAVEHGDRVQVRVLPRRVPLHHTAPGSRSAAAGPTDSVDVGGTDLVGLHEYTPGDDLRRLHWATSARTGVLMVREDADPAEPHVCVLLDDRAAAYDDAPGTEPFEDAVELAAALCAVTVAAGQPLRFRVTSGRHTVDVPASPSGLPHPGGEEIALLLAEIGTVATGDPVGDVAGIRDADVAVAVSGVGAGETEVAALLGSGHRRFVMLLDPRPFVGSGQTGDVLVLRGAGSFGLAEQWDLAVTA